MDELVDDTGRDAFAGGAHADAVDARDSGGQRAGRTADTVTCEDGDAIRIDREDTVVNPAECDDIDR
jgi:hypothetical protein